jgi:hypothetical protein
MGDPVTAAIAAAASGALLGAGTQVQAGRIADYEAKTEADAIRTSAAAREADRKEALARAVSSQSAGAGAAGIAFQGSPLTILEEDIRREEVATERDRLQTRMESQAARLRGTVARRSARLQAISGLLKFGGQAAGAMGGTPSGGGGPTTKQSQIDIAATERGRYGLTGPR